MHVDVNVTINHQTLELPNIIKLLNNVLGEMQTMSAAFDALKASVEAENTEIDSAMALIDLLVANRDDPQALQDLANEVSQKRDQLHAALTANTPSSGTPVPPPTDTTPVTSVPSDTSESGTAPTP